MIIPYTMPAVASRVKPAYQDRSSHRCQETGLAQHRCPPMGEKSRMFDKLRRRLDHTDVAARFKLQNKLALRPEAGTLRES